MEHLSENELTRLLDLVYMHTRVRMAPTKSTLLEGRLKPRVSSLKLSSFKEYIDVVSSDPRELKFFIDAVTTHETYFNRTPRVWDFFAKEYLNSLTKKDFTTPLSIWSAAASTGEEAYTIAMYCEEYIKTHRNFKYSIYASDISAEVIKTAQKARYHGHSLDALKKVNPAFMEKYMINLGNEEMEVKADIKSKVQFAQQNLFLLKDIPNQFDIIFLRNVLIYFDTSDQQKLILNLEKHLAPEGVLIIGESESLFSLETNLVSLSPLVYGRKAIA